jgi:hypothetical protein
MCEYMYVCRMYVCTRMYVHAYIRMLFYRTGYPNSHASDSYEEGLVFESRTEHQLSRLMFSVAFLRPSSKLLRQ